MSGARRLPKSWAEVLAPGGAFSPLVVLRSSPDGVARAHRGWVLMAAPYLSEVKLRDAWRYERSVRASVLASVEVARLAECGVTAVCPAITQAEIAHARDLLAAPPDPLDLGWWASWCAPLMVEARTVVVPAIDGWQRCPLVWRMVATALGQNARVHVYGGADGL